MSADNYYEVFEQHGRWYAAHKFASSCWYGEGSNMAADHANFAAEQMAYNRGPAFPTMEDALAWASEQDSEYGVSLASKRREYK